MTDTCTQMPAKYTIIHLPAGEFAVVELRPHVIAWFEDKHHAQVFVNSLVNAVQPAPKSVVGLATPDRQRQPAPPQHTSSVTDVTQLQATPMQEDWQAALQRREAGEDLQTIATETGLPYNTLRAKWAGQQRGKKKDTAGTDFRQKAQQERSRRLDRATPKDNGVTDDACERPDRVARTTTEWTDDQDMKILEAPDDIALQKLAKEWALSISAIQFRKTQLTIDIAADMENSGEGVVA